MSVTFQVRGAAEAVAYLRSFPVAVQRAAELRMIELARSLSEEVKRKLSGELLQVRSGELRASIYGRAYLSKNKITIALGSRGGVPYAAILEYGGVIPAHEITPVKANVLSWMSGSRRAAAARVQHPGALMKEYSYLRSTLADTPKKVADILRDAAREVSSGGI